MDFDVHGLARGLGRDHDLIDHCAQGVEDHVARLAFTHPVEMQAQFADELTVAIGRGRVQHDRFIVDGKIVSLGTQLITIGLKAAQPVEQCVCGATVDDQVDKAFDLAIEVGQATGNGLALIGLGLCQLAARRVILGQVFSDHVRVGEICIERLEDAILDMDPGNSAIVRAVATFAMAGAADAVIADHGIAGATAAALGQA